jgi:hypothetical protein
MPNGVEFFINIRMQAREAGKPDSFPIQGFFILGLPRWQFSDFGEGV